MGAGERKQQHKPARDPTAVWIREMARREKESSLSWRSIKLAATLRHVCACQCMVRELSGSVRMPSMPGSLSGKQPQDVG